MRVLPVAALLLLVPLASVQAHSEHGGFHALELDSLKLTFNPLNQSQEFTFHLWNNHTLKTGALFARITLVDEMLTVSNVRVSGAGLVADGHGNFTASVPARVSVRGCIVVDATGSGGVSNAECGQTSGLSLAPVDIPVTIPAVTQIDDEVTPENLPQPEVPDGLPLPTDELPALPEAPALPSLP